MGWGRVGEYWVRWGGVGEVGQDGKGWGLEFRVDGVG